MHTPLRRADDSSLTAAEPASGGDTAPATVLEAHAFVIVGRTTAGERFRPSDWAERLCGVMSQFGTDHRMRYSPHVQPVTLDGVKCVAVNRRLLEVEPLAFRFLEQFARDNELQVRASQSGAG